MDGGSAPQAPDPVATAEAQGKYNKETAIASYGLNATDQVTPYGNLSYTQGTPWSDGTPHYTATTSLSPEQQNLYNLSTQTQSNLGNIGVEQSDKVRGILNTPFDLNAATNNQQAEIARKLMDPQWQQREGQLTQKLANQGIQQGSEAYTNALRDFGMQRDNSYNSALLAGRGQATQEALSQRNQPLNEISALLSNSQVSQPNFVGTPQSQVANTDYAGIVNNNYQGQMAQYQADQKKQGALYGALGSAAGSLGGWAMMSDRRTKENVQRVGELDNGLPVYSYNHIGDDVPRIGLMADEVEKVRPDAVTEIDGIKHVFYDRAVR